MALPGGSGMHIHDLSDDLLAAVLRGVADSSQLRVAACACRRWAGLLRSRLELWHEVQLALPPKRSRGRDRRNSYTTPCALNVERLAAWLARRASAICSLDVALLYPDALPLLGSLLPPLAPALRRLVLRGAVSDWPFLSVDWRWLAGMAQLETLELWNALPGMADLVVPPGLTELLVDRVGEGDPNTAGWDELPASFSRLSRLRRLRLGTAATYLLGSEEEAAFAPLRALRGLQELRLTEGTLCAVPDALTAQRALTLLSFRGCGQLEPFGELCLHKRDPFQPLVALRRLRLLDFSLCGLERLPTGMGGLLELRTLLLADNQLTGLPPPPPPATAAPAPAAAGPASTLGSRRHRAGGSGSAGAAASPPALPPRLERLDLAGNRFAVLPAAALAACSALRDLDLSRCWQLHLGPADWHGLAAALPALRSLRHSCPLLASEMRGGGGAYGLSAVAGPSCELELEFCSAPGSRPAAGGGGEGHSGAATGSACDGLGGSRRAISCVGLRDLEAAAAMLLGTGMSPGGSTLAELAATASGGGGGGWWESQQGGPGRSS